jgi:hypothetical protein
MEPIGPAEGSLRWPEFLFATNASGRLALACVEGAKRYPRLQEFRTESDATYHSANDTVENHTEREAASNRTSRKYGRSVYVIPEHFLP